MRCYADRVRAILPCHRGKYPRGAFGCRLIFRGVWVHMHEMALVRNVVDIVVDQAQKAHASEVKAVYLTIGSGRDVVIEYLDGLFQFLARGTVAEHAELVVQTTPMTVKCNQCGFVFPINVFKPETWVCPSCKAEKDYKLNSGMEFMINRIEVAGERPAPVQEEPGAGA